MVDFVLSKNEKNPGGSLEAVWMNQNFRGEGCVHPPNEKGNAIWQISRSRNNNLPLPSVNSRFTRIRSFGPIHERKRVHPRPVVSTVFVWADLPLCPSTPISPPRGVQRKTCREEKRAWARGGFYRLSTRAGKRAQLDGFKHGLPLFPTTSTTPYLGHCSRVVKMERYRVCAAREEEAEKNSLKLES